MQENEFEKKLQQKLETLQVQPTTEVWQKVKEQVAQKKRKRRLAFIFLLVVLLGAGTVATIMLLNNHNSNNTIVAESKTKENAETGPATNNPGGDKSGAAENVTAKEDVQQLTSVRNKPATIDFTNGDITTSEGVQNSTAEKVYKTTISSAAKSHNPIKRKTKVKLGIETKTPDVDKADVYDFADVTAADKKNSSSVSPTVLTKEENIVNNNVASGEKQNNTFETVPKQKTEEAANDKKGTEKTVAAVKKDKKNNTNRKWGITFSVACGISSTSGSNMNKSLAQDYNNGGVVSTPGGPTAGANYDLSSQLQPGAAFAAGVQVYRKLNSSLKLTAGLQYSYNSLSLKTGSPIDSNGNRTAMYNTGSSVVYNSRYHYLSIPISLSVKVFNVGNHEVLIDGGASISQLLATNALTYNYTQSRYYSGVNELNKTMLSLSASACINLAGNNKPAFYLGPQINYSLTALAPEGLHGARHLTFIGLRMQKNLWK